MFLSCCVDVGGILRLALLKALSNRPYKVSTHCLCLAEHPEEALRQYVNLLKGSRTLTLTVLHDDAC